VILSRKATTSQAKNGYFCQMVVVICDTWCSHNNVDKKSNLLRCYGMLTSKYKKLLIFQRNTVAPSLKSIGPQTVILGLPDPEDGSTMLLQNISNYLPGGTV
jgi:hypothetical protein